MSVYVSIIGIHVGIHACFSCYGPLQYNIIKFDTMIKIEIKGHKHKGESKQQCNQIMKKLLVQKDKLICSKMQTSPKLMHITW